MMDFLFKSFATVYDLRARINCSRSPLSRFRRTAVDSHHHNRRLAVRSHENLNKIYVINKTAKYDSR